MAEIWLTKEELSKREEYLNYLKTTRRLEIAEQLKIARGFGDLSENAEYDAAKNEQAKNEYDIAKLEDDLRSVHIFEEDTQRSDVVSVGSVVTFRNIKGGESMTYQIVGSSAADPANKMISNESPIGAALLGKAVGETAVADTPGGFLHFLVEKIGK